MTEPEILVGATADDQRIIAGLRAGDETAFIEMVDRYNGSLVRVAMRYVPSRAVAEEVVQDTWIGVIEGIDRFEGRSTIKTWLYKILIYKARARGERERQNGAIVCTGRRRLSTLRADRAISGFGCLVGRPLGDAAATMGRRRRGPPTGGRGTVRDRRGHRRAAPRPTRSDRDA